MGQGAARQAAKRHCAPHGTAYGQHEALSLGPAAPPYILAVSRQREALQFGGVIGSVFVRDIVTRSDSPGFRKGATALVFADARPEPFMPVHGQTGRIAITQAAYDAICATLPLGSVGYENKVNEKGERLIWLEPASGASVDQVDCLLRADIDIGHIRRLTVGVFPAQIHVTILALRYFSPRPLAGFQRA